jgi:hypothetical protein
MAMDIGSRQEHLDWCKRRALQYVEIGDLEQAFASMASDMTKHSETQNHAGLEIGALMLLGGQLDTPERMRKFIEGFN